ncbi:cytochrome P450 [Propylenella binzhouense]|uniref:Cytochrome P450 n=1 Tax=Propylenella binzhouense TaxID=2555902 RepID=A0A964T1N4_9HYPH|nr:cytochrome P450 [Propylenella binzhouense]MYZ46741.1 cytochrome P450 [Propylenella binzhouense]
MTERDPVKLAHPKAPLSRAALLRTLVRNPLEVWPEAAFDQAIGSERLFGRQTVSVFDPDLIRTVLVDEADAFRKGEVVLRTLGPALGNGILTSDGADWRRQRRTAAPIFRHERILGFVPAMIAAAERTAARWRAFPDGTVVDVADAMMRTTFDVVVETMLSGAGDIDVSGFSRAITDYLDPIGWQAAFSLLGAPRWMPHPGSRRAAAARRYLRAELGRVIAERRRSPVPRDDLIELLLAACDGDTGRRMGDEELADNLLTFVTAGHETTALALTWSLYLLGGSPATEARVRQEIHAEMPPGAAVTPAAVERLPFTRQVILEAMRLYPPAPLIVRKAVRPVRIGPVAVEEGARVQVPVYVVHRHRALWAAPDRFDPGRFAPEAAKARHRYAYLPFGAGPRICIGMGFALLEATAILAVLLRTARLEPLPGHAPYPVLKITLRPRGGLPMRVRSGA